MYVTDGWNIILAISSKRKGESCLQTYSTIQKNFYKYKLGTAKFANFTREHPYIEDKAFFHPYHPQYFFGEDFDLFCEKRDEILLDNPCEVLIF